MSRHSYSRYRAARKIALILAAAPLFQLSACQTGFQQISAGVLNSLPAAIFNIVQGFVLAPIQAILFGTTGGA